jgi:hypothetical protein
MKETKTNQITEELDQPENLSETLKMKKTKTKPKNILNPENPQKPEVEIIGEIKTTPEKEIEKLLEERERITREFQEHKTQFQTNLKQIYKALKNFTRSNAALGQTVIRQRGMTEAIEEILQNKEKLHLKEIVAALSEKGYTPIYQSVSGLLQTYAKADKKFVKVGPATFALIENKEAKPLQITKEKGVVTSA